MNPDGDFAGGGGAEAGEADVFAAFGPCAVIGRAGGGLDHAVDGESGGEVGRADEEDAVFPGRIEPADLEGRGVAETGEDAVVLQGCHAAAEGGGAVERGAEAAFQPDVDGGGRAVGADEVVELERMDDGVRTAVAGGGERDLEVVPERAGIGGRAGSGVKRGGWIGAGIGAVDDVAAEVGIHRDGRGRQ